MARRNILSSEIAVKDNRKRSILKTLSWRVTATLTTMLIAYFIIGDYKSALQIGSIEVFAKMLLYYFHERTWDKVTFGRTSSKK